MRARQVSRTRRSSGLRSVSMWSTRWLAFLELRCGRCRSSWIRTLARTGHTIPLSRLSRLVLSRGNIVNRLVRSSSRFTSAVMSRLPTLEGSLHGSAAHPLDWWSPPCWITCESVYKTASSGAWGRPLAIRARRCCTGRASELVRTPSSSRGDCRRDWAVW